MAEWFVYYAIFAVILVFVVSFYEGARGYLIEKNAKKAAIEKHRQEAANHARIIQQEKNQLKVVEDEERARKDKLARLLDEL